MSTTDDDDEEMEFVAREIEMAADPGHLGEHEPVLRPLCSHCVHDLPTGDDGLCDFCRIMTPPTV